MYTTPTYAAAGVTGSTLAYTGFETGHYIVAAASLILAGLALLKFIPRAKKDTE